MHDPLDLLLLILICRHFTREVSLLSTWIGEGRLWRIRDVPTFALYFAARWNWEEERVGSLLEAEACALFDNSIVVRKSSEGSRVLVLLHQ